MAQDTLSVLERPVRLHVGSQCPAQHLKGDEANRDAEFPGNGANAQFEKVLARTRHRLPRFIRLN